MEHAGLGKRAGGIAVALGVQALLAALFLFSLFRHFVPPPPAHEMTLWLPPAPQLRPSQVIDARGPPARRAPPPPSPASSPSVPATSTPPLPAPPPPAFAPPPPAPTPSKNDVLTSPYQPKNQAHWDAEMEKKNNQIIPETKSAAAPSLTTGVGTIGITIADPLCKLAVWLAGTGSCGPRVAVQTSTDAQFQAALDAYHKRRGGGPPSALASAPQTGAGDARIGGGSSGGVPVPDPGPGR